MPPVISAQDVTRKFAENVGVFDLTFDVQPGVIFGLVGPSGSGKTTTVRLLTGLHQYDTGELSVLGHKPRDFTTEVRDMIAYMPQQFVLYPTLTVWENLHFMASIYGVPFAGRKRWFNDLLEFTDLASARNRLAQNLSGGMQRRLMLACALVHDPQLIFADEPTAGIDPVLRGRFWEHFRELRNTGRTLFVTTQYIGEVAYCDIVGVMRDGRLLYLDTPDGLRRRALGGEVIRIEVEPQQVQGALRRIYDHPQVRDVRRSRSTNGLIYAYTDDAGAVLPQLITSLAQEPSIPVTVAEEYLPPFDDVFIMLMEQSEQQEQQNAAVEAKMLEREVVNG